MNATEKPKLKIFSWSRMIFLFVLTLMIALGLYSCLAKNDTTRTHFKPAQTAQHTFTAGQEIAVTDTELIDFYSMIQSKGTLTYDQAFETAYPTLTRAMTDRDFCADEVELFSADTGNYLTVIDGYVADYDYLMRGLDILMVPYYMEENRLTVEKPIRFTVVYDTTLSTVTLRELDEENFRLSFYTLKAAFENDDKVTCQMFFQKTASEKEIKHIAKKTTLLHGERSCLLINSGPKWGGHDYLMSNLYLEPNASVTVEFTDVTYRYFERVTFYLGDGTKFQIGVNQ